MREWFYGNDEVVSKWVCNKLKVPSIPDAKAIVYAEDAEVMAAAIYYGYTGRMIEMSIFTTTPAWCNRESLATFFAYPFQQCGVRRLQIIVHKKNKKMREFALRLGFVYEGMGREAWPTGGDAACYSMLDDECRWLRGTDGQEVTKAAANA